MSESTVVNFAPFAIKQEFKPGIFPGIYMIEAAKNLESPSLTYIQDASRNVFLDGDRGSQAVLVTAETLAKSLVKDFIEAQPAQENGVCGPALFYVPTKIDKEKLVKEHAPEIQAAIEQQGTWWKRLVRLADDTWTQTHKHIHISDLERLACRQLGLKRDWLDDSPDSIFGCPVCTTIISTSAIVCFACKAILKPEELKKFQFVGGVVGGK